MIASEYSGLYENEETLWWFAGMRAIVEAIDDRVPIGETLAIGIAVSLHHGRGLHNRRRGLGLPGQAAADHVQPALDPEPLLGISHREQTPSPQGRLDLQAAKA